MNDESVNLFLSYALTISQKLGIGIEKAIDLSIAEAPALYAEVLWFLRIEVLFYMIPAGVMLLTISLIARKLIKHFLSVERRSELEPPAAPFVAATVIVAFLASLLPGHAFVKSAKELTQLAFAPRIYLAKKAYDLYRMPAEPRK